MQTCYSDRPDLHHTFVISMMTADTIGKIPGIIAILYLAKVSQTILKKVAVTYPVATKTLTWGTALSAVVYAVIQARNEIQNGELSPAEIDRVNYIMNGIREGGQATGDLVLQLAEDEITAQKKRYEESDSEEEKQAIINHINNIKEKQDFYLHLSNLSE